MKRGSVSLNSFVSIVALAILIFVFTLGSYHLSILKNIYELKANLNKLDKQVYLEVLVMQRLKYAVETMDYNEDELEYEGTTVNITYDFEDITVIYTYEDREYTKYYHYDLKTKTLEIVNELP